MRTITLYYYEELKPQAQIKAMKDFEKAVGIKASVKELENQFIMMRYEFLEDGTWVNV